MHLLSNCQLMSRPMGFLNKYFLTYFPLYNLRIKNRLSIILLKRFRLSFLICCVEFTSSNVGHPTKSASRTVIILVVFYLLFS